MPLPLSISAKYSTAQRLNRSSRLMKALIRILRNGVTHALSLVTSTAAGNVFRQSLKVSLLALAISSLTSCKKRTLPAPQGDKSAVTQPNPAKTNPELPARPAKEIITPAQVAFWDYIEAFHRLPDNPTDVQRAIFATRGDVKPFHFISTSPTSVFADVAGMKAHRECFAQRYPWVRNLLEREHITLEVDEAVFSGSAGEILKKHGRKVDVYEGNFYQTYGNRALFTKRWLESLLSVDYIFACGSAQDRSDGLLLLDQTMSEAQGPGQDTPERAKRGAELEIPAVQQIAIPLANEFAQQVPESLVNFLPYLISSAEHPGPFIDCLKWALRVKAFGKWDNIMRLNQIQVGNHCVRHGLLHQAIYWYHLQENPRPNPGSAGLAIKALFHKINGPQQGPKEHQKYLALLDAAYPPPPKTATGKATAASVPAPVKKKP